MYLWDPLGSIILSGFISRKLFFINPDPSLTVVSLEPLLNFYLIILADTKEFGDISGGKRIKIYINPL
jgi:hypothetical protein